jgi:hypothetical protein
MIMLLAKQHVETNDAINGFPYVAWYPYLWPHQAIYFYHLLYKIQLIDGRNRAIPCKPARWLVFHPRFHGWLSSSASIHFPTVSYPGLLAGA